MKQPTITRCPVCDQTFTQPIRKQGGGRRTIYCSPKCRSLDWIRGNGGKRKAHVLKYDNKPENKEKKVIRTRKATLAEYGLDEEDFQIMRLRQNNRCLGCSQELSLRDSRIDHDHVTGTVRGLLCNSCNLALGLVRDDRARLYQLAAYLELDRSRPIVYLIGSLRNPKVVEVGNAIRDLEFTCIDNWFATGKIADDAWRDYSRACGKTYQEALESREAVHTFYFDRAYLRLCDAVVLLYPAGKSGHLELGYGVGAGKRGYILLEEEHQPDRYDVMLQFGSAGLFTTLPELLKQLQEDYGTLEKRRGAY